MRQRSLLRSAMRAVVLVTFSLTPAASRAAEAPENYVFFNRDRERIHDEAFLQTTALVGAQLKYTWRELEPRKDQYEVSLVVDDLEFLESKGKKLFIQLQEVSFSTDIINVPGYLTDDAEYGGGIALQYEFEGDGDANATPTGWVARRWDPAVQRRFHALLMVLGKHLDGRIAGINLPETSVGFMQNGTHQPAGFTYDGYREAIKTTMSAARAAFRHSVVLQYANFMPGEWLPWENHGYLESIYAHAHDIGAGVGNPDLMPHRKGQRNHSYALLHARETSVPAGVAVQWGNYEHRVPGENRTITVREIHSFARDYLRLDWIFWCTQEPYYSRDVIPFLRSLDSR